MILTDTSVWIDHLRRGDTGLERLLAAERVSTHPFVVGELACGNLSDRASVLESLDALPASRVADDGEVRRFIERHRLYGRGVGFVDCHLLVSVLLSSETSLWTRDRRLAVIAEEMAIAYPEHDALH